MANLGIHWLLNKPLWLNYNHRTDADNWCKESFFCLVKLVFHKMRSSKVADGHKVHFCSSSKLHLNFAADFWRRQGSVRLTVTGRIIPPFFNNLVLPDLWNWGLLTSLPVRSDNITDMTIELAFKSWKCHTSRSPPIPLETLQLQRHLMVMLTLTLGNITDVSGNFTWCAPYSPDRHSAPSTYVS